MAVSQTLNGVTAAVMACCLVLAVVQISHPPRMVLQSRAPEVNVWQQIGAQEPHAAANLVMKQNDDTGYKARKVQLAERAAPSVWQQIGAQEPHAAANLVMKQNDDTGYKARKVQLAQ